ncbi:MAG: hypothetical protein QNI99_20220 [Woeseiaceae bacterium]|nr:hypothetical protein [Woeseiaceae bacterium]
MASKKEDTWFGRFFKKKADPAEARKYHAVIIRAGREPCQEVVERSGDRLLSADAPLLPLKECDRPEKCSCRYQHYEDRRKGPRRGDEIGMPGKKDPDQMERRNVRGRRADDIPEEDEQKPISVHEDSYFQHAEDTTRTVTLEVQEEANDPEGVDPYNSGSFDKSKAWKSATKK